MKGTATVVAAYQLMSNMTGEEFLEDVLGKAVARGDIKSFSVKGVYRGIWSIQLCDFTVDVEINEEQSEEGLRFFVGQSRDEAKQQADDYLNMVIGDTDVEIRWLSSMEDNDGS